MTMGFRDKKVFGRADQLIVVPIKVGVERKNKKTTGQCLYIVLSALWVYFEKCVV